MRIIWSIALTLSLAACATMKQDWSAVGGSKSDGTIKLSYTQNMFAKYTDESSIALDLAKKKCINWGYKNAEKFGGETYDCLHSSYMYGCEIRKVFVEFQCLDK
jgi:hypothetical protein